MCTRVRTNTIDLKVESRYRKDTTVHEIGTCIYALEVISPRSELNFLSVISK